MLNTSYYIRGEQADGELVWVSVEEMEAGDERS